MYWVKFDLIKLLKQTTFMQGLIMRFSNVRETGESDTWSYFGIRVSDIIALFHSF